LLQQRSAEVEAFIEATYPMAGPRLQAVSGSDMGGIVAHFLLTKYDEGKREEEVTAYVAALRHVWSAEGRDSSFLDGPAVQMACQAAKRSNPERREHAATRDPSTTKLKAGLPFLAATRLALGEGPITYDNVDQWMEYAVEVMLFDGVFRICELTEPTGSAKEREGHDHMIRSGDVAFHVAMPDGGEEVVFGAQDLRAILAAGGVERDLSRVVRIVWYLDSDKTRMDRISKIMERRTPAESAAVDVVLAVLIAGNARDDQGAFTRCRNSELAGGGRKRELKFQADRIRGSTKVAAVDLGLDPKFFSSQSWRKGGLSTMERNGAPKAVQAARGVWVEGSAAMLAVYTLPDQAPVGPLGTLGVGMDFSGEVASLAKQVQGLTARTRGRSAKAAGRRW
jgi:hypothetical protein